MRRPESILAVAAAAILCAGAASSATRIQLASGEILVVDVVENDGKTVRLVHPLLGEFTLPADKIVILPPLEASESSEGAGAAATADEAAPSSPPPPPPAPPTAAPAAKEWKFKLLLGGAMSEGNTESANLTTTFTAIREVPTMKTALDTGYFFTSSNGDRSENRFTAGLRNDWLNPGSKWFYFADARYDNDEFQSWDQRVNGHVGLGYKLIEPPKFKLNALAGIGAVKEWGSENEDVRPEALFGIEGAYEFAQKHTLTFSSTIYPDLNDLGEFRWLNAAGWKFLLDQETMLSLNAGVEHEYQSKVDPGRKQNDVRATVGVALEF
jgi:putative salt-induced outer membrane protein YdiY